LNRPPEIHIALLRLAPEYLSLFNETAANEWFLTVEGLSYGWDNFMFGWIDTSTQNYPYPLSEEILPIAMSIVDRLAPQYSQFYLNGLNKRLGTANLTTEEIFALLPQRGLNFTDLMVMVEQDSWDYGKGPSMVSKTHSSPSLPPYSFPSYFWFSLISSRFHSLLFTRFAVSSQWTFIEQVESSQNFQTSISKQQNSLQRTLIKFKYSIPTGEDHNLVL
jgi:hypothetical protein